MIKLIVGRIQDEKYIIGEFHIEQNIIINCFQLVTILINNTFHYNIKPLLLPFCLAKPVIIHINQILEWVEIDLTIFDNLVIEYIRVKNEIGNVTNKPEINKVQIH